MLEKMVKIDDNMIAIKSHLEEISDLIARTHSENELLNLVISRNESFHEGTSKEGKNQSNYKSYCEVLASSTKIPIELRAYHSGPISQSELVNGDKLFEGYKLTNHVYFSIDIEEVVIDYLLPENFNDRIVYVADLSKSKNARIQTSYESEVLWNDKIRTLISSYNDEKFLEQLIKEKDLVVDFRYISHLVDKPREKLKEEAIKEIKGWVDTYTVPFDPRELESYRKKGWSYILVPSPIIVI